MAGPPDFHLNWTNLAAFGMLMLVAAGGGWKLVQQELGSQNRAHSAEVRALRDQEAAEVRALKDEEAIRHRFVDDRLARLTVLIDDINRELIQRRSEFLNMDEFRQFAARVETLRESLKVIEATRPTTGELQGTAKNMQDRLDRQEARIHELESWLRDSKARSVN